MSSSARHIRVQNSTWEISPAGEFLLQRCKRNQKTAGGGSRAFNNALSRLPRTPCFLRGSHQGARLYPSGAGKGQDTAPRAARCRSVPVEQPPTPTRGDAPNLLPSREGAGRRSAARTCAGLAETYRKTRLRPGTAPASGLRHLLRRFAAEPSRAPPTPGGVHPIGGIAIPPDWSF